MSIAIMTSGGDSAGMNPAVKRFVDYSLERGERPFLIHDGLRGLLEDKVVPAEKSIVSGIIHRGGTVLGSSRSKDFRDAGLRPWAYDNLLKRGINKLVIVGGDGSFNAGRIMSEECAIRVAGIPATIDNDIPGTDYCLGVDTALNVIRQAIDDIRDTAASFGRAFVVETMGRHCGYLAAVSALTSGAELCLIPEVTFDLTSAAKRLQNDIRGGRRYAIAVVAEGVGGCDKIVKWFEDEIGMESRASALGHIQRGGSPTVFDRRMGFLFATAAVDALCSGQSGVVTVANGGKVNLAPIQDIASTTYQMDPYILKMVSRLSR
ncbi:MAG: 6-phosphofructokinase [Verrucomicrobiales bacterium]